MRIEPSISGTQPPSAELNRSRAPARASSSTLGARPSARHTVSQAISRSVPVIGFASPSTETSTTDSTSPVRPRASRTVCEVRIGTPASARARAALASPRTASATSTTAATSTPCSTASAAVRKPSSPEPSTTIRRAASAR